MLRSMHDLENYAIGASDGEVGHVTDIYFDDQAWVIRYLVVDTGSWLISRKVLISPYAVQEADWERKRLPVRLTREQVKGSPDVDTQKPVSRQHEMDYADYYNYPYYWGGEGFWGDGMYFPVAPIPSEDAKVHARAERARHKNDDPHLRSCRAVMGHQIHATDGDIGHVQGMLVDEETWAIRYLVVNTSDWWLGNQVLIPPEWIAEISWAEFKVSINLTRKTIKNSPRYESSEALNREQEMALHRHYDRPTYWEREHAKKIETMS